MEKLQSSFTVLEFDKIRALLADCTSTDGARELCLSLPMQKDPEVIKRLLQETTAAKTMQMKKGLPPFGGVKDIHESLVKAEKGACLLPLELLRIGNVLRTTRSLVEYAHEGKRDESILDERFERLFSFPTLEREIYGTIIGEDQIADNASPELSEIRRKIASAQNKIREVLLKYTSTQSKYLQENLITTRDGRYVIPVKAEYRSEVKGIVHDTSASGSTVFIEPMAVVELNNDIRELESREKHEIERILYALSAAVANYAEKIRLNYQNIIELGVIFARSELSYRMNAVEPVITEDRFLCLKKARHPLIESKKVVPISLELGHDKPMMVITGPNTGGKTVTLKTIGLFSMMAQSGLHLPCEEGSTICVFDGIYSDIGDEQSIEQSLSTFSSHMKRVITILESMTSKSLVLFDELGAGTDPVEGAAIATSILETVLAKEALCAVTTHYAELKVFAIEQPKVLNASCEFDVETLQPTYRLLIGTPGKSNAFAISSRLGLSEEVIHRAEELLNQESRDFENVISELDASRRLLDKEMEKAKESRLEFENYKRNAEAELKKRLGNAEKEAKHMRDQAQQTLDSARVTSSYIMSQLDEARKELETEKAAQKLNEKKKAIRDRISDYQATLNGPETDDEEDYVLPRPLVKGDFVLHRNLGQRGTLLDNPDKKSMVNVQFGNVKLHVSTSDLRLLDKAMKEEKIRQNNTKKNQKELLAKTFKPELDIRGETGDDGWFMVDQYLDEAIFAHVNKVSVIHGKGTGALRNTIWANLKKDKRVASYRPGQFGEGDYGVTVIELKN